MPQAHIYSLGATLKAALEYVAEPEPRLSQDLELLLRQMQAEDPRNRPDLEVMAGVPREADTRDPPWSRAHARMQTLLSPAHRLLACGLVALHFV